MRQERREKRDQRVPVALSRSEMEALRRAAEAEGRPLCNYVRWAALKAMEAQAGQMEAMK